MPFSHFPKVVARLVTTTLILNDMDNFPNKVSVHAEHSPSDDDPVPAALLLTTKSRDGYGFRSASGMSTPLTMPSRDSPLPDPNGLGWPGTSLIRTTTSAILILSLAKSTVSRLNETTTERSAREKMMVSAVRTILECIGEDPDREGLLKTPERYAQAIMWMTRGYEERLAGNKAQLHIHINPALSEISFPSSRCHQRCRLRGRSRRDGPSPRDRYFKSLRASSRPFHRKSMCPPTPSHVRLPFIYS
jgi:hypothetical protein